MSSARYTLTVRDAATRLGLSMDLIYAMAERGEIAHLRIRGRVTTRIVDGRAVERAKGGRIRFSEADLDEWERANRVPMRRAAAPRASAATVMDLPMPKVRRFS